MAYDSDSSSGLSVISCWEDLDISEVPQKNDLVSRAMRNGNDLISRAMRDGKDLRTDSKKPIISLPRKPFDPRNGVTLLKRAAPASSSFSGVCEPLVKEVATPKRLTKSLKQRELEYAAARLRILGDTGIPAEAPGESKIGQDEIEKKMQYLWDDAHYTNGMQGAKKK